MDHRNANNPIDIDTTRDDEQHRDHVREHSGLRTHDAHYSAQEVYRACHCPYPGTDVLREKERQQARDSTDHAQYRPRTGGRTGAAAQDRRGESGVSL